MKRSVAIVALIALAVAATAIVGAVAGSVPAAPAALSRLEPERPPQRFGVATLGDGVVTIHDPAGAVVRRLPLQDAMENTHVWSPDRTMLLYRAGDERESMLVVQRADGSARWRLPKLGDHPRSPTWSPDSRRIAFVDSAADRPDGSGLHLGVVNVDGSGLRPLGTNGGRSVEAPEWSPDGKWILYTQSGSIVVLVSPDGGEPVTITTREIMDLGAVWSPSSGHIAVCSLGVENKNGLVVMRLDGSDRAVAHPNDCGLQAWSPDAKRLAVTEGIPKTLLSVVPLDGSPAVTLLRHEDVNGGLWAPVWSPDGQWIAVGVSAPRNALGERGPQSTIVIRADGSEMYRLESGGQPQWVPLGP